MLAAAPVSGHAQARAPRDRCEESEAVGKDPTVCFLAETFPSQNPMMLVAFALPVAAAFAPMHPLPTRFTSAHLQLSPPRRCRVRMRMEEPKAGVCRVLCRVCVCV